MLNIWVTAKMPDDFSLKSFFDDASDNTSSPTEALITKLQNQDLTIKPYDPDNRGESGRIYNQDGQEVTQQEMGTMRREVRTAIRDIRGGIKEEYGTNALLENETLNGKDVPTFKLFELEGGEATLKAKFPEHAEEIEQACTLQTLGSELTRIQSEAALIAKDGYMVKSLEESGFSFGKPGGTDLVQ